MARKNKYEYPIVYVEWEDACTNDAWHTTKEAKDQGVHPCHTVGWLLLKDKKEIHIVETYSTDDNGEDEKVFASVTIPISTVTKMVVIKKA